MSNVAKISELMRRLRWSRIHLLERQIGKVECYAKLNRHINRTSEVFSELEHMKQMMKFEHQYRLSRVVKKRWSDKQNRYRHTNAEYDIGDVDVKMRNFRANSHILDEINTIALDCSFVGHQIRLMFDNRTMKLEVSMKANFGGSWVKACVNLGDEPELFSQRAMEFRVAILAGVGML